MINQNSLTSFSLLKFKVNPIILVILQMCPEIKKKKLRNTGLSDKLISRTLPLQCTSIGCYDTNI